MNVNDFGRSLSGKRVLVCGLARSGIALINTLKDLGALVTAADMKSSLDFDIGVPVFLGKNPDEIVANFDIIAISPGIPIDTPFIDKAREAGAWVTGEVELSSRLCEAPIIGITGTNGKTTTTTLVGEILSQINPDTFVVGNIGEPFSGRVLDIPKSGIVVAEISSFMLETCESFSPSIAAILNVTPDHLNRHKTMEIYAELKAKIFKNQQETDFTILNADDPITLSMASLTHGKPILFSLLRNLSEEGSYQGVYLSKGTICARLLNIDEDIIGIDELQVFGNHNIENVMAACAIAICANVPLENLRSALRGFKSVPHRIEYVRNINGVNYFNDSKATNVDAAIKGIEAFDTPLVLIVGGRPKASDFGGLARLFPGRCSHVIAIGEAAPLILESCRVADYKNVQVAASMADAVQKSKEIAVPGECVLLSPACASFDMFDNFEHRGDVFKEFVNALSEN